MPVFIELPQALTGVSARIVVALGALFPMIRAHKVLAAYACLAPRLVAGRFDPTRQRAVWPSTGNYCRGGVAISRILGCRGVCRAAGGHEPGAVRLAGAAGSTRPAISSARPARNPTSRKSTTSARSWRAIPPTRSSTSSASSAITWRTGAAPARHWSGFSRPWRNVAGPAARGLRFRQRLGRHAGRRRLPQGQARHEDRRGRGRRMPDAAHERLWRAQHPGHRRQARAADPQRDEHRPRDRRQRQGHRRPQRRLQHR